MSPHRPALIAAAALALAGMLLLAPPAHGQPESPAAERLTLIDRTGGPITAAVTLADGSVIAAEGSSLVRLDPSVTPMIAVARADAGHGLILDLAAAPPLLLALTEQGLLALPYDSSGGIPPPLSFTPGGGQSLAAGGGWAAVAAREAGVRLLRLDGQGRAAADHAIPLPGRALDAAFAPDGTRLYVAAGEAGVQVIDMAAPGGPALLGMLPGSAPADAVAPVGLLLAVGIRGQVRLIDPMPGAGEVGQFAGLKDARQILAQDGYLYIADGRDGLKILWLAAPDRPVQVYGEADHPASAVQGADGLAYVAGPDGLRIVDVSSPTRPRELSRLPLPGTPRGLTLSDPPGRVFAALGDEGVAVINVDNLSAPQLTRRIPLGGEALALLQAGSTLYVALGDEGLAMIEVGEPGQEAVAATRALPGPALDLVRRGDALYIAAGEAGLLAFDIIRPLAPALVGVLTLDPLRAAGEGEETPAAQGALAVTIAGKRAYVASGDSISVVDISRPDRLARLAQVEVPAHRIALSEVYLYAASGSHVRIFDVRATAEPIPLRTYHGLDDITRMTASDDRVLIAGGGTGPDLLVLSAAAPDAPLEFDSSASTGGAYRAIPAPGDIVWLAAGSDGLRRYAISEGGALLPGGGYRPVSDAAVLAADGIRLLAGGREGWSLVDIAGGGLAMRGGSSPSLPVTGLAVEGTAAAAALGSAGVALYDLAGADGPALAARAETYGPASGVALDADYLYAADAGGLSIFDRRYLLPVARVAAPAPARAVTLRGRYAYLALDDGSLAVIDRADPSGGIVRAGTLPTRRPTDLIPGPDGRLYGLADETISSLRVGDPARPAVIAQGTLPALAARGLFSGPLLAAFSPGDRLRFYDIADLEGGVAWEGSVDLAADGEAAEVALSGRTLYGAYGAGGLGLIPLDAPARRTVFFDEPVHSVILDGETLLAAGQSLTAWDVRDPYAPVWLGALPLTAPARHLDRAPDGLLLVSMENGLSIVSQEGGALRQVGHLAVDQVDRAALIGSRIYAALHRGGLLVADASDRSRPAPLFTYTSPAGRFVYDLLPLDDSRLLVSWEGGIDALEIDAPGMPPHLVSVTPSVGSAALNVSLDARGEQLALSLGADGVQLFDLGDPASPQPGPSADTPGEALAAAFVGEAVAVADGVCGVRVFQRGPDGLQEAAAWRGFAGSVLAGSDRLYAGGAGQLSVLRYDPSAPAAAPAVPHSPSPADGSGDAPLDAVLSWGPLPDPCDPLVYAVYFGVANDPPWAGQVVGQPMLAVGPLDPALTYTWRVEAVNRQGGRSSSPRWRFTTARGAVPDLIPPAPPLFMQRLQQDPAVSAGLLAVFALAAAAGFWYWRRHHTTHPGDEAVPAWYTTEDEDRRGG